MKTDKCDRREMMSRMGKAGLALAGFEMLAGGVPALAAEGGKARVEGPAVAVASSGTVMQKVKSAIDKLGGIGRFVKKGAKVVIKPNGAWACPPQWAANTHPLILDALIKLCREAGAGSVNVIEHTCDNAKIAFQQNGLEDICKKNGIQIIDAGAPHYYRPVNVPKGKNLKATNVLSMLLDADCYINAPVVKVHGGATVSLGMKNHMGAVEDRAFWHMNNLHQCIADACTVLKPHLNVLDATRILLTNGPRGPGKVEKPGKIIASTDIVAGDAYAATLLGYKPEQIGHIAMAAQMGIGVMDLKKIRLIQA